MKIYFANYTSLILFKSKYYTHIVLVWIENLNLKKKETSINLEFLCSYCSPSLMHSDQLSISLFFLVLPNPSCFIVCQGSRKKRFNISNRICVQRIIYACARVCVVFAQNTKLIMIWNFYAWNWKLSCFIICTRKMKPTANMS